MVDLSKMNEDEGNKQIEHLNFNITKSKPNVYNN